jgi:hypothetical protein
MLHFPFWMARLANSIAAQPENVGLQPVAFSSPRKLSAYLAARNAQHWQLHLVTRYSAVTYLTELKLLGYSTISLNPREDGSNDATLQIGDILESLTS